MFLNYGVLMLLLLLLLLPQEPYSIQKILLLMFLNYGVLMLLLLLLLLLLLPHEHIAAVTASRTYSTQENPYYLCF